MSQIEELFKQVKKATPTKDLPVLEDVNLLKSISQYPTSLSSPKWNHYIEPIEVEFFASKVGKFVQLIKYLFIELSDPITEKKEHSKVHNYFKQKNRPIDIVETMNMFPQYTMTILDYCNEFMNFHEKIGSAILDGLEGNIESILQALYLTEVIRKKEPTLATFEILGDYIRYNLNWYIRHLNQKDVKFSLEDETIYYLMNVYINEKNDTGKVIDERFYYLREIYIHQAFSNMEDDIG